MSEDNAEEPVTRAHAAQAIGRAIKAQAAKLTTAEDSPAASAALKDLAEALAWLHNPNQPH